MSHALRTPVITVLFLLAVANVVASAAEPGSPTEQTNYYVRNRGYRTLPETDPPRYVRNLGKTGIAVFKDLDWLDVGLDHRLRYEYRDDDFRRTPQQGHDDPLLLRTRVYLGVRKRFDPLRFVVEYEDAERYNSAYPRDDRDVNQFELIQLYGELYFADLLGANRPLSIRGGRQAFELVDRRLIANNEFRNTTNNFQGVRIKLGQQTNDWELDLLGLQPIERRLYDFDQRFDDQWLYGAVASWRRWSGVVTLQPYYLGFRQGGDKGQDLHTLGLRGYGIVGSTGWDYEIDGVRQLGESGGNQDQDAWAYAVEVGYTAERQVWKPRASVFYGYGTGDQHPNDDQNQRFNPLFGFNQPWSRNDYFSWDNVHAPKARIEAAPHQDVLIDAGYNAYWLASDTDAWQRANLRDKTGKSGSFLGHELDARVRYKLTARIATDVSYAYFTPGDFPRNLGKHNDSHFFYFQMSISAFE